LRILGTVDIRVVDLAKQEARVTVPDAAGNTIAVEGGGAVERIGGFIGAEGVNALRASRIAVGPARQTPFRSQLGRMVAMHPGSGRRGSESVVVVMVGVGWPYTRRVAQAKQFRK